LTGSPAKASLSPTGQSTGSALSPLESGHYRAPQLGRIDGFIPEQQV